MFVSKDSGLFARAFSADRAAHSNYRRTGRCPDVDRTATHSPSANKGCIVCKHDDRYESTDQYRAAINSYQNVQKFVAFRA